MPTKHVPRPHTNTLASRLKMPEQARRLFRKKDPPPPAPSARAPGENALETAALQSSSVPPKGKKRGVLGLHREDTIG